MSKFIVKGDTNIESLNMINKSLIKGGKNQSNLTKTYTIDICPKYLSMKKI